MRYKQRSRDILKAAAQTLGRIESLDDISRVLTEEEKTRYQTLLETRHALVDREVVPFVQGALGEFIGHGIMKYMVKRLGRDAYIQEGTPGTCQTSLDGRVKMEYGQSGMNVLFSNPEENTQLEVDGIVVYQGVPALLECTTRVKNFEIENNFLPHQLRKAKKKRKLASKFTREFYKSHAEYIQVYISDERKFTRDGEVSVLHFPFREELQQIARQLQKEKQQT